MLKNGVRKKCKDTNIERELKLCAKKIKTNNRRLLMRRPHGGFKRPNRNRIGIIENEKFKNIKKWCAKIEKIWYTKIIKEELKK